MYIPVVFVTCSLPDPVPLEKDSDGHPVRISIPEPVRGNDYLTVSLYTCIHNNCM